MQMAKKVLAAVNDESDVNVSESLSGRVTFQLDNLVNTITVQFEARMRNCPNWVSIQVVNLATGALVTSAAAAGLFRVDASGQLDIRARVSASTGSIDCYPGVSLG